MQHIIGPNVKYELTVLYTISHAYVYNHVLIWWRQHAYSRIIERNVCGIKKITYMCIIQAEMSKELRDLCVFDLFSFIIHTEILYVKQY